MPKSKEEKAKYLADWYQKNKARHAIVGKVWREKNKESQKAYWANYRKNNRESINKYRKNWAEKNPDRDRISKKRCYQKNKERYIANAIIKQRERRKLRQKAWLIRASRHKTNGNHRSKSAFYRVKKITGVPPWVSYKQLNDFYIKCPDGYVVDHIIPIVHKSVCGLHVLWNLQYLPMLDNAKKGNKIYD